MFKDNSGLKRYDPNKTRFSPDAIRKKLVAASAADEGRPTGKPDYSVDKGSARKVVDGTAEHITDAKSVFEVLPDTKLAMDILVSCIMSPNDMIANDLLFRVKRNSVEVDDEVTPILLGVIEEYFTNTVNLSKLCVPALEDMLFKTGSYPIIAVPRSGIDNIINGASVSIESLGEDFDDDFNVKNIGFLSGTSPDEANSAVSMESFTANAKRQVDTIQAGPHLTLVDNPTILKKPMFMERVREEKSRNLLDMMSYTSKIKVSQEAIGDSPAAEKEIVLYGKRKFKNTPFMELMDVTEVGDEEPIFFHPPSESIIPINVPGDVTRKVGYFVVLDDAGNPVSIASSKKHWDRLKRTISGSDGEQSEMSRIREQLFGGDEHKDVKTVKEMQRAYVTHLERKLHTSLKNGVHGEDVELEISEEAEMLMMSRAMGRMKTQLLYIPKELMVYMAFDYNELGVGKSLLEATKIISSMRAMLLLANTQAGMRNSTPGTKLDIELDPLDKDPDGTVEKVLTLRNQANAGGFPLGDLDLTSIANAMNRANIQVSVSNHPAYPQTKVVSEDISRSVGTVDTDMEDRLRERHHQGWGVTPEMIDATRDTDFAANIIMGNKLMVKRVSVYQGTFTGFLTDTAKLFTRLSPSIQEQLIEKLKEADVKVDRIEDTINEFLENFEVSLPSPDSSKVVTQLEELSAYMDILDRALEAYFSEDLFDSLVNTDLEDAIIPAQAAIRAYFIRNWIRNNNILPEIEAMFSFDDGEAIFDHHAEFTTGVLKVLSNTLRKTSKVGRQHEVDTDKDIETEEKKVEREAAEAQALIDKEEQAKLDRANAVDTEEDVDPQEGDELPLEEDTTTDLDVNPEEDVVPETDV
jgi:hypothetical protein